MKRVHMCSLSFSLSLSLTLTLTLSLSLTLTLTLSLSLTLSLTHSLTHTLSHALTSNAGPPKREGAGGSTERSSSSSPFLSGFQHPAFTALFVAITISSLGPMFMGTFLQYLLRTTRYFKGVGNRPTKSR